MRRSVTSTPTQVPSEVTREPPPHPNWLILGVAAGLLIVVAGAVGWWIGSSRNDNTSDLAGELPEIVERYFDTLIDDDTEALAALFTDDGIVTGVLEDDTRSWLFRREQIKSMVGAWLLYVDYTDIEILDIIADGHTVTVMSRWSGISSPHERGSEDKTPFSAPGVEVFELDNGLIARCDMYFEYDEVVN